MTITMEMEITMKRIAQRPRPTLWPSATPALPVALVLSRLATPWCATRCATARSSPTSSATPWRAGTIRSSAGARGAARGEPARAHRAVRHGAAAPGEPAQAPAEGPAPEATGDGVGGTLGPAACAANQTMLERAVACEALGRRGLSSPKPMILGPASWQTSGHPPPLASQILLCGSRQAQACWKQGAGLVSDAQLLASPSAPRAHPCRHTATSRGTPLSRLRPGFMRRACPKPKPQAPRLP
jgi:hypothetical protein